MATLSTTISPSELALKLRDATVEIVDVRTPAEFQEAHIESAKNVPLSDLDPCSLIESLEPGTTLYLICQSGSRGAITCDKLRAAGYESAVNVAGGTQAWIDAGLPVIRGRKAISLERQVRIVAGLLVVLGILLGYFWNLNFLWLSAFVGTGLMFAGITDTCGMALILARMPWNRARAKSCSLTT